MDRYRHGWMTVMAEREFMRMVDTMIQGSVLQGCTFFASTAIFLIGGLLAMLGATDAALEVLKDLPFAVETTRALWQIKVLGMVTVLIYAFFKFAWAHRLYTYCIVVMGADPDQRGGRNSALRGAGGPAARPRGAPFRPRGSAPTTTRWPRPRGSSTRPCSCSPPCG